MDAWVIWFIAAAALAVGEMTNLSFYLAPFAGGAFVAGLVSLAGAGFGISFVVFAAVTALIFGVVRPIARRHVRMPPHVRTGTAALIGRPAIVLERIANREGVGCVKLDGEIWTARAYDDEKVFDAGEQVEVVEIRGATALVTD
jgi:membrane protein implicated in regulation of membrane protease activity